MEEAIGEELLTLSLGINGSTTAWSATAAKKRKVRDSMHDVGDDQFLRLLQARDQMMKLENPRGVSGGIDDGNGLQLMHLLLSSVAALEVHDVRSSVAALQEIYKNVSFHGDPIQRVAAYFADALASRLLRTTSPAVVSSCPPTRTEEFSAFTMFYQASPYYQFAHFTANQAIIEAFEDEEERNCGRLHVIDFDVSYGFQWPSLIQSLSDIATTSDKPISLRITEFGRSTDVLKETEARLIHFASGCRNLSFEYEGVLRGSRTCDPIKIDENATLAVNLVFHLQNVKSSREAHATLACIQSLNPSLVFLIEKEAGSDLNTRSLLPRFVAYLQYFAAMFDSLNECLPADSLERLNIERNHLGREIKCAMACEETVQDHKVESSSTTSWKERMESIGFEGIKLSSRTVSQAKLLLKIKSRCSGGFRVLERDNGRAMSLGWQDRLLITASGWRCCRRSSAAR